MASIEEIFKNDLINIDLLPKYEEVELISLSPKHLYKKFISTSIWFIIFIIGISSASAFLNAFGEYYFIAVVVVVLLFGWFYYCNYMWQKKAGYALREKDIIFKRGFLIEKSTVVPFNRIQHVSTNRGIIDKFLNLSTLNIFTAGGSGSDISIPGLTPEMAENLKEALSERISGHA